MVWGFDEPRPMREQYDECISGLVRSLDGIGNRNISFFVFGSFLRNDFVVGRSDVDCMLCFPDDVVINKNELMHVARAYADASCHPLQATICDVCTMRDGRFSSYNVSFKSYFRTEGRSFFGPNYTSEFCYTHLNHSESEALRYNLRKVRQGLFEAPRMMRKEAVYLEFLQRFKKALDAVTRGSKQLYFAKTGDFEASRFSALAKIEREFPGTDVSVLERLRWYYDHPKQMDVVYRNGNVALELWISATNCFEQMVRGFIRTVPKDSFER